MRRNSTIILFSLFLGILLLSTACNLSTSNVREETLTAQPTLTGTIGTPSTGTVTTTGTITPGFSIPTSLPGIGTRPTSISVVPPTRIVVIPPTQPVNNNTPVSIVILSPANGNVLAGNVQVIGSASHPLLLQYTVEYGPDPNANNLWYPATGAVQNTVQNALLGIWNTTSIPDGLYRLRLRVYLRDGTILETVTNNVRVQNQQPTPIPSATPNIPRPIAAFNQNVTSGISPLTVQFTNQSSGNVTGLTWNFGDGGTSGEQNPSHTFTSPGLYTVSLTVTGPGGTANVARQINVQSQSAPVAAFTVNREIGDAPFTVQFTNQSTGNITSYFWNFSDGNTSTQREPSHTFTTPGLYNVFLTVSGAGGSSFVNRQVMVQLPPATQAPNTATTIPPTTAVAVVPSPTTEPPTTEPEPPTTQPSLTPEPATAEPSATVTPEPSATETLPVPNTSIGTNTTSGTAPLLVQFSGNVDQPVLSYQWDFGDGNTSTDQNPSHEYANPGSYTVNFSITYQDGTTTPSTTLITVDPPSVPLTASFTSDISSGTVPFNVNFTDSSTGPIASYLWDFGDGATSTDQNPSHEYTVAGSYTVMLTITGTDSTTASTTAIIDAAPGQVVPNLPEIVVNAPAVPPVNEPNMISGLQNIHNQGVTNNGVTTQSLTIAGDETLMSGNVLNPFAQPGYNLDAHGNLQAVVDNFANNPSMNGFNHNSAATGSGWRVADLLDPARVDSSCGATPIACELATTQPTIMLIAVGANDAMNNTDPSAFAQSLTQAVQEIKGYGTIPVLITIPSRLDGFVSQDTINALNTVIINTANAEGIPLINLAGGLLNVPNSGLGSDNATLDVAPSGAGDLSQAHAYGTNALNLYILQTLDSILRNAIPGSLP